MCSYFFSLFFFEVISNKNNSLIVTKILFLTKPWSGTYEPPPRVGSDFWTSVFIFAWPNFILWSKCLYVLKIHVLKGLPWWISGKEYTCQCRRSNRLGFDPWVRKIPWKRAWQPTPVFLPGESHGQRSLSLVSSSPWGRKESGTAEATWHARRHKLSKTDDAFSALAH